jgi:hypothetical protein
MAATADTSTEAPISVPMYQQATTTTPHSSPSCLGAYVAKFLNISAGHMSVVALVQLFILFFLMRCLFLYEKALKITSGAC